MTAEEYARRKAAGVCTWAGNCAAPATHGVMCQPHREQYRATNKAWLRARYWSAKERGKCTGMTAGCTGRPGDTLMCEVCQPVNEARQKRYRRKKAARP